MLRTPTTFFYSHIARIFSQTTVRFPASAHPSPFTFAPHRAVAMSATRPPWRVLITNEIPAAGLERLKACAGLELDYDPSRGGLSEADLIAKLSDGVDAVYCLLTDRITAPVIAAGGDRLRLISTMSVGYNHVDVAACASAGVSLAHTPDVLTETTADTAVGLALAACRRFKEATASVADGTWGAWRPEWMCGPDVHGSTVGIIGLGRIGAAVARRLRAFNCRILYSGRRPKPDLAGPLQAEFVDVDTLLATSDIVLPLCPLSPETEGMFDRKAFGKMKRTAVFVNAARGELVVQDDLIEALKAGDIFAAGLDVTTPEPLPTDSPLVNMPNCFVLPHVGSASLATRGGMAAMAAENLVAMYEGKPIPHEVKL